MSRRIIAVSGGLWTPSKTTALAQILLDTLSDRFDAEPELIELGPIAAELGATLGRPAASSAVERALVAAESADVLIAASPVFRGSYSGHFKHFFDLVAVERFLGKPVVLAATGGGEKHCLVVEHQLRPLFAFFRAASLPTAVYATERDFAAGELVGATVLERIEAVAEELEAYQRPAFDELPEDSSRRFRGRGVRRVAHAD